MEEQHGRALCVCRLNRIRTVGVSPLEVPTGHADRRLVDGESSDSDFSSYGIDESVN